MRRGAAPAVMLVVLLSALASCAGPRSLARRHPEEVAGAPRCGDCHEAEYDSMSHTVSFRQRHATEAARREEICYLCHRPSSCADCHAGKEELKPSDKFKAAPNRYYPHRGDYITRHRIDGRVDPAACFACHGRRSDPRCEACHK